MTATLPGDIPGLLRRGSVVLVQVDVGVTSPGVAVYTHDAAVTVLVATSGALREERSRRLALDLTDPTSRAHAAWWLCEQDWDDVEAAVLEHAGSPDAARLIERWASGRDCTPTSIEALQLVVLHVAGRAS